eukprot:m.1700 g.1700  ORF g.1700 m.1700 type:complete len:92 (-) comp2484_c0_seq1:64-339(-)
MIRMYVFCLMNLSLLALTKLSQITLGSEDLNVNLVALKVRQPVIQSTMLMLWCHRNNSSVCVERFATTLLSFVLEQKPPIIHVADCFTNLS